MFLYNKVFGLRLDERQQFAHSGRRSLPDMRHATEFSAADGIGVDKVNGAIGRGVLYQSGSRINVERRAYNDKNIRLFGLIDGRIQHGDALSKEDNERP